MNQEQLRLLNKMKKLIIAKKRKFENRIDRNYIDDLLELGLDVESAWNQILMLNNNFYFFDPMPSYKKDNNVLIFKKNINGILTYIKLKLQNYNDEIVVCLSFHRDNKEKGYKNEM